MNIKSFSLTFILIVVTGIAHAQKSPLPLQGWADEYTYDEVGNRIKREYKWTIIAPKNNYHEEQTVDTLKERSDDKGLSSNILVKAYPNPVADEMIVENLSWKDNNTATVKISDITGRVLVEKNFKAAKEQFSLSSFIPGTYIVSYFLNNRSLITWKIIKK